MNKVQDILREVAANPFKTNQAIDQALKDLYVLIEGVIGDMEPAVIERWEKNKPRHITNDNGLARNILRTQQRQALKELFGENE